MKYNHSKSKPNRLRPAFTLIELLVVIAIVGILIAILLPAINSVRMSTRATVCKSNLRQLGMGVQAYIEKSGGRLPAQWRTANPTAWDNFGWAVSILPMIEQQNVKDRLDLKATPFAEQNRDLTSISIPVFECPATPSQPRKIRSLGGTNYSVADMEAGAKDYAAIHSVTSVDGNTMQRGAWNGGASSISINSANEMDDAEAPGSADFNLNPGEARLQVDSFNRQVRTISANASRIRDGFTSTALLVEQAGKPDFHGTSNLPSPSFEGPWASAELNNFSGDAVNSNNRRDPFSFHRSVNVVMCDASVHSWSESIDPIVMRALLSSDGGEIVDMTDSQ